MLLTYGLLLFSYVFAQLVSGAPLLSKRNLVSIREDLDPLANSKTISDNLELASLDKYPDPDSASVVLSMDKFLSINSGSDYFARKPALEFYPTDSDFERSDVDEIPAMDDNEPFLQGETDMLIRPRNDLAIHARSVESLQKAGQGMQTAGEIMGKVAKAADAIPEVGEIIGTAIQVVATFVKYIGKLLNEVAEDEKESARARGDFTKKVTDQTLKKHPGWLIVTVHPKHTVFFQGQENIDWAHDKTHITTKVGLFEFDVYSARAGIFMNNGDGGYQNWAFSAPQNQLQTYGDQGHRLVYTGGPPKNSKPKSGNCGIHLYQYQKNEKRSNPTNHYTLVVVIKDAAGIVVGFEGNGDTSKPVLVHSQLPLALQITAGEKDSSPLSFTYGKDSWKSNVKPHCTVGSIPGLVQGTSATISGHIQYPHLPGDWKEGLGPGGTRLGFHLDVP
ncbi:hypothetical protein F5876DRAFT_69156 [Lentinula aff. lateritia]|uniref:Uncharacterized protein n=1 Tax=Lentinula aff. lateritia TaxID=2804960 RepID=A0ACC1TNM5_9AGAR|nr:hypothetical protein F5876DRAFT_69156 [Lentinula aff. lateritia]